MDFAQTGLFHDVGKIIMSTKRSREEDKDELEELRHDHKVNIKRAICCQSKANRQPGRNLALCHSDPHPRPSIRFSSPSPRVLCQNPSSPRL